MTDAQPWLSVENRDPSRIQISDDVVGLVYEATGQREFDGDGYRANILSVYRRRNEDWAADPASTDCPRLLMRPVSAYRARITRITRASRH